ncbi:hypothetical protein Caci_5047 [Catenulispora acidiphila DSM 44928]|uniref:Uncharacterized protein n=1 Tax=Catenulispora acidiphila (strain DSM 44928 / JCM 14897 / NBRC 102108 / NRRL B-24433 / ID139908) TaxID=479433 RepID=C7Q4V9_CATAD|nr:hypothetical protein [Catenulispora acidiphila]ACU73907.1 hypothetical protein Caci_5047 [Catenulispora acidiphila DSM 44928]
MELVLVRLTAPATVPPPVSPEAVVDILWSVAVPDDRLEHVRARHGPRPEAVDLGVFVRTDATSAEEAATSLCRRAIATAPSLSDWSIGVLSMLRDSRW